MHKKSVGVFTQKNDCVLEKYNTRSVGIYAWAHKRFYMGIKQIDNFKIF